MLHFIASQALLRGKQQWTLPGAAVATFLCVAVAICDERTGEKTVDSKVIAQTADSTIAERKAFTPEAARERAQVMHSVYAATLEVMHRRYFHGDRAVVPARAMEDIFSEMKRESGVDARWISVNLKPMNIDHEPKSDFEKRAVKEISEGKNDLEVVENGFYRRAGAIPLAGGCVGCHGGFFKDVPKTPRFAGLVINIPVAEK